MSGFSPLCNLLCNRPGHVNQDVSFKLALYSVIGFVFFSSKSFSRINAVVIIDSLEENPYVHSPCFVGGRIGGGDNLYDVIKDDEKEKLV